jgi:fructokinase
MFGGIEAGGTKFVCAVGTGPDDLHATIQFETGSPAETLGHAIGFFKRQEPIRAIGIGSFGPVDLNPTSAAFGFITSTPKPGWSKIDFKGTFQRELSLPVVLDTDVNAAALGEHRWGAAQGIENFIYLTIGTGIGGGGMMNGALMHGLIHPEIGHIRIPHDLNVDPFKGICPFHGDCFEGLASGPSMESRWEMSPQNLQLDHPAWELEARYLALACANLILTLSPQRIILGGGVMRHSGLFVMIQGRVQQLLNGYVKAQEILEDIAGYIVPPRLGDKAGVLGAIALAIDAMGD